MERRDLQELRRRLNAATEELYTSDAAVFRPKLYIDAVILPEDLDRELIEALEKMEPFGHKNPKPLFCMRGVVPERPVFLGDDGRHARFRAGGIDAILFQKASAHRDHLSAGRPLDLAGHLEFNRWNGKEKIQFVTTDLRWYNE
jgi:single-stranded-DNA-specific exonuclease